MNNLLERGFLFLESGNFEKADEYFERVLDQDCKNPKAYLGKLMVEREVSVVDDLATCNTPLESSENYQLIMRFDENQDFKADIKKYNDVIIERNSAFNSQNKQDFPKARKNLKFIAIVLCLTAVVLSAVTTIIFFVPSKEKNYNEPVFSENTSPKKEQQPAVEKEKNTGNETKSFEELISTGYSHTIGLKSDGTFITVGGNPNGERNIGQWTNIKSIQAGYIHTAGLKHDGTVAAVGRNDCGQCNVSDWTDIVEISVGICHTVGLKSDGTVVIAGESYYLDENSAIDWTDIVDISVGSEHLLGLKKDGTVVAVGNNEDGRLNVESWKDIIKIEAGEFHSVGLKSDGTVLSIGGDSLYAERNYVGNWTDIVDISAGWLHTVGLKSDGTVVATGSNEVRQCEVSDWTDIVKISAGTAYTVGVKSDGTVVAVGDNEDGQCNVQDWDLF